MSASAQSNLPHHDDGDCIAWLGLVQTPFLGSRGIHNLLEVYQTPLAIYHASLTGLEACGLAPEAAQFIHTGKALELGAMEFDKLRALGAELVAWTDRCYPELLREIYDPPALLYVRGNLAALDTFGVAVVGTRRPSVYGKTIAEHLGHDLAAWGLTVFSGLARGIDTAGHKGALEGNGCAVAVLGTGVDNIYPTENKKLAEQILQQGGALVSEFPMGTFPAPHNFPTRNRIISGLALGVVVVEGGEHSGSRITARLALEQNREVFGVPGMVTSRNAWLPNALIKQGAKLVCEAADVVEELPSHVRVRLQTPAPATTGASPELPEGPAGAILSRLRVDEALHIDQIQEQLPSLQTQQILAALFELELAGQVTQLPGKNYVRKMR